MNRMEAACGRNSGEGAWGIRYRNSARSSQHEPVSEVDCAARSGGVSDPPCTTCVGSVVCLEVLDQRFHLVDFTALRLDDAVRQLAPPWVLDIRPLAGEDGGGVVGNHPLTSEGGRVGQGGVCTCRT